MAGLRDTSAYSAYLRGHDELRSRLQQLDRIVVTPIVLGELDAGFRAGSQRKQNEAELRRFLASPRLRWFRWTRRPPSATARSCTPCGPPARPFPTNDLWIAASAMQHGLRVLTTDAHYNRVAQILVEFFGDG